MVECSWAMVEYSRAKVEPIRAMVECSTVKYSQVEPW